MSNSPEELNTSAENTVEAQEAAGKQLEKLTSENAEKNVEKSVENAERTESRARQEALESAVSVEAGGAEKKKDSSEKSRTVTRGPISKKQKDISYKRTMKEVQAEMSPASRAFSKVIHNKAVEKTSEVIGSTVARPNAVLAGAVFAFILTLAAYVTAKHFGYVLSGFETIGAFIVGWIVGIVYDYLHALVTGKKS
jgi:hypothetical protein